MGYITLPKGVWWTNLIWKKKMLFDDQATICTSKSGCWIFITGVFALESVIDGFKN